MKMSLPELWPTPPERRLQLGETTVHWLHNGLLLSHARGHLLIDPWGPLQELPLHDGAPVACILTHPAAHLAAGLLQTLSMVPAHVGSMPLLAPTGDERLPAVIGAWQQGWPDGIKVSLDTLTAPMTLVQGPFTVHCEPLGFAERQGDEPIGLPGFGVRVTLPGDHTVAWLPLSSGTMAARSLLAGVDLAVVEVTPDRSHRLPPRPFPRAQQLATGARRVWWVDATGHRLHAEGPEN